MKDFTGSPTARRHYGSSPPSLHLAIILSHLCASVALISCLVTQFREKTQLGEHYSRSLSVPRSLAASWHIEHFCKVASLCQSPHHGQALVTPPARPSDAVERCREAGTGGRGAERLQSLPPPWSTRKQTSRPPELTWDAKRTDLTKV